jgi:hypothetical protein
MSLVIYAARPYFQLPCFPINGGMLTEMSGIELKLYVWLHCEAQRRTKVRLDYTSEFLCSHVGLSPHSVKEARELLRKHGLIRVERGIANTYVYVLCNPKTGEPLPDPKAKSLPIEGKESSAVARQPIRRFGKDIRDLSEEQYQKYYESRLDGRALSSNGKWSSTMCPFHDDANPSLSVNFKAGTWRCHGCKNKGGVLKFEQLFSKCDKNAAFRNIAEIVGEPGLVRSQKLAEAEAVYPYFDESGKILYSVFRYPGKKFKVARSDENNNLIWNLEGVRRVPYNLPQVMAATHVIVTEGEKDADSVNSLNLEAADGTRVAVTTNVFGAGNWLEKYSPYLVDKRVLIFPDDDLDGEKETGYEQATAVRDSVAKYAKEVDIIPFTTEELGEGGKDVSDYLKNHTGDELRDKILSKHPDWLSVPQVVEI